MANLQENKHNAEMYQKRVDRNRRAKEELESIEKDIKNERLIRESIDKRQKFSNYYDEVVIAVNTMISSDDYKVIVNAMAYAQENLLKLYRENDREVRLYNLKSDYRNSPYRLSTIEETFDIERYYDELFNCAKHMSESKYVEDMAEYLYLAEKYLNEVWKICLNKVKD